MDNRNREGQDWVYRKESKGSNEQENNTEQRKLWLNDKE